MTDKARMIGGPYGPCEHGGVGALLNYCRHPEHVPLRIVEDFSVSLNEIKHRGEVVARYKWVDEIDTPLIRWSHHAYRVYSRQTFMRTQEDIDDEIVNFLIPKFRLTLSVHDTPAFEIDGQDASEELHAFLKDMLTNYTPDPRYKLHQDAGAFFQGGSNDPKGKWFLIEFWKPAGAQAFVDYMNANYRPKPFSTTPKI